MSCYIFIRLIYAGRLYLVEDRGLTAFRQLLGTELDQHPAMAERYRQRLSYEKTDTISDGLDRFLIQPMDDALLRECHHSEIIDDDFLRTLILSLRRNDRKVSHGFRSLVRSDHELSKFLQTQRPRTLSNDSDKTHSRTSGWTMRSRRYR